MGHSQKVIVLSKVPLDLNTGWELIFARVFLDRHGNGWSASSIWESSVVVQLVFVNWVFLL